MTEVVSESFASDDDGSRDEHEMKILTTIAGNR
jgi:hypothetical protein